MGYCTQSDLQAAIADARMAELTAESGTAIDTTILAKVITSASSVIDRYLGGRYAVPVTSATALDLLKPICIVLCKFELYGRRDLEAKDDPLRVEYDDAVRWLRDVSKGDASLPPATAAAQTADGGDSTVLGSEDVVYGDGGWWL